jgi:hypothetical protein
MRAERRAAATGLAAAIAVAKRKAAAGLFASFFLILYPFHYSPGDYILDAYGAISYRPNHGETAVSP